METRIHRKAWLYFCVLSIWLVVSLCGCSRPGQVAQEVLNQTLPPVVYRPVAPISWQLDNGLTVLFLKDDELPLVQGTLYLRGGTLWEEFDSLGVLSAVGSQMRLGGAGKYSADQLDLELERLAASVSSSYGSEYGTVSFGSLGSDFERVFKLFSDVVLEPRFEEDRLNLWINQGLDGVKRRKEDPETVASVAFDQLLYGNSAYGWVVKSEHLSKINRLDLLRLHRKFVRPNGAILAVSGNIDENALRQAVQDQFGEWVPRAQDLGPPPPVGKAQYGKVVFVELPFEQATIYFGHEGVARLSPDQYAISAFNSIFGTGGFGSRLMKVIRSERGLAYVTYGAILPALATGKNIVVLQTKAVSAGDALSEAIRVLNQMRTGLVTEKELEETKRSIESSFVFKFDSSGQVVSRTALLNLLGYPKNYDQTFIPSIRALSALDVQEVARSRWKPAEFIIVVVGNKNAYTSIQKLFDERSGPLKGYELLTAEFDEALLLPE